MITQVDPVRGAGHVFVHPALFYRGEREYLAGAESFVREGLDLGEPVAVAVPGPRLALLRGALGTESSRVTWLDMTRAGRNPGRIIPGVLRAFADRHPDGRVRIIGEPIWPGRSAAEYPACVQHEALINMAFEGRAVTILCPYDVAGLEAGVLTDARATHPEIIDAAGRRHSDGYAPEQIISAYNRPLSRPAGAVELAYDSSTLPEVRRFTCEHAARLGLGDDQVGDLELAVNELAANSVVHAGGTGTLRIWAAAGHVIAEAYDTGHLTDPLVGRRPVALGTDGGRGVLMVNHLADLVRVHTTAEGTTTRLYMRL